LFLEQPVEMAITIFLDESGDLGFEFTKPYREGGSSRFLTIGALCVPPPKKHLPKRIIKDLYQRFGWNRAKEKKWADMSESARREFAARARGMCDQHTDIQLRAITVRKENVMAHIRSDSNKLYNYMARLSLLEFMSNHNSVTLIPDARAIKVQSGNSLNDYLQIELWFTKSVQTNLATIPQDSQHCIGLQFADMLAGLVQAHFEDGERANFHVLAPRIRLSQLYFGA
jgi:hypothetical protein